MQPIFTRRSYARVVLGVVILSVRLSVNFKQQIKNNRYTIANQKQTKFTIEKITQCSAILTMFGGHLESKLPVNSSHGQLSHHDEFTVWKQQNVTT